MVLTSGEAGEVLTMGASRSDVDTANKGKFPERGESPVSVTASWPKRLVTSGGDETFKGPRVNR